MSFWLVLKEESESDLDPLPIRIGKCFDLVRPELELESKTKYDIKYSIYLAYLMLDNVIDRSLWVRLTSRVGIEEDRRNCYVAPQIKSTSTTITWRNNHALPSSLH